MYKSIDGGKSWENVGLKESEHIGKILIDPRDSDVVYVAAQGPLWNPGGDRGLYKSVDGGDFWELVLEISENTGVTDIVFHPRDPDTLYAAAYQRRRRVWTLKPKAPWDHAQACKCPSGRPQEPSAAPAVVLRHLVPPLLRA